MAKPSVICLMGLTATGKTALAMQLYDKFPVEIISVDSAMVYRGMDIGTAKPQPKQLEQYPHHLIDIIEPTESYSAAQFRHDVVQLINAIHERNKIPLLVGGTMLYFKALQQGLHALPQSNDVIREKLQRLKAEFGLDYLFQRLQQVDRLTAARLKPNDTQRIMRALEVYELAGKPLSELFQQNKSLSPYHYINIGLVPTQRECLHQLIEQRFDEMLDMGVLEEVKGLLQQGVTREMPSLRSVGYKQIVDYLDGQVDRQSMRFKAIAATRQLAKRQHTWLRGWTALKLFEPWQAQLEHEVGLFLKESVGF